MLLQQQHRHHHHNCRRDESHDTTVITPCGRPPEMRRSQSPPPPPYEVEPTAQSSSPMNPAAYKFSSSLLSSSSLQPTPPPNNPWRRSKGCSLYPSSAIFLLLLFIIATTTLFPTPVTGAFVPPPPDQTHHHHHEMNMLNTISNNSAAVVVMNNNNSSSSPTGDSPPGSPPLKSPPALPHQMLKPPVVQALVGAPGSDAVDERCEEFGETPPGVYEFHSPGYPEEYHENLNCIKVISAGEGEVIHLRFIDHFNIEADGDRCQYDYLEVRDGQYGYSELIWTLCGSTPPTVIQSSGRHLWLRFHSDKDIQYVGFRAFFEFVASPLARPDLDDCSFHETEIENWVGSENVTEEILASRRDLAVQQLDCTWKIEAPPNQKIYLQFLFFKLEKANDCSYNFVEIYGERTVLYGNSGRLKQFCGSETDNVFSKSNVLHLRFFSTLTLGRGELGVEFKTRLRVYYNFYRDLSEKVKATDGSLIVQEGCREGEEFDCTDNSCIEFALTCNGFTNCKAGQDEDKDMCRNRNKVAFEMTMDLIVIAFIGCFLAAGMCSGLILNICRKLHQDKIELDEIRASLHKSHDSVGTKSSKSKSAHDLDSSNNGGGGGGPPGGDRPSSSSAAATRASASILSVFKKKDSSSSGGGTTKPQAAPTAASSSSSSSNAPTTGAPNSTTETNNSVDTVVFKPQKEGGAGGGGRSTKTGGGGGGHGATAVAAAAPPPVPVTSHYGWLKGPSSVTTPSATSIPYSPPPPYNPQQQLMLTSSSHRPMTSKTVQVQEPPQPPAPNDNEEEEEVAVIEVRDSACQTRESFTESYLRDVYFGRPKHYFTNNNNSRHPLASAPVQVVSRSSPGFMYGSGGYYHPHHQQPSSSAQSPVASSPSRYHVPPTTTTPPYNTPTTTTAPPASASTRRAPLARGEAVEHLDPVHSATAGLPRLKQVRRVPKGPADVLMYPRSPGSVASSVDASTGSLELLHEIDEEVEETEKKMMMKKNKQKEAEENKKKKMKKQEGEDDDDDDDGKEEEDGGEKKNTGKKKGSSSSNGDDGSSSSSSSDPKNDNDDDDEEEEGKDKSSKKPDHHHQQHSKRGSGSSSGYKELHV